MVKIAASILSLIPFSIDKIDLVKDSIDYLHLDIMDGHFVPRISFGQQFVEKIRDITDLPLDVHLMITNPEIQMESFIKAGGKRITLHVETIRDFKTLRAITDRHKTGLGLSISPDTPIDELMPFINEIDSILIMSVHPGFSGQRFLPSTTEKIKEVNTIKTERSLNCQIMVDGGINLTTAENVIKAGADVLVIGSGIFYSLDPLKEVEKIKLLSLEVIGKG
jgi:ribulose-phosphate 3-epimerase